MEDPALREEFARDVVLLKYVGMNPVVVHGGGPEITHYMERLGMPVEFVGGLRVSDAETVEVAKMVLVGKVNKDIVLRLGRHGQSAVGLCGDDGGAVPRLARRPRRTGSDIGFVGQDRARRRRRRQPRRAGLHPGDRVDRRRPRRAEPQHQRRRGRGRGRARARRLQGDVPDRRRRLAARPGRPERRSSARRAPTRSRRRSTRSTAACARSSQACVDAIHGGVPRAHIVDGRVPHSLLLELFTDAGIGTKIRPGEVSLRASCGLEREHLVADVRAAARRVRARRGRAAVGRRRRRVPRLPDRLAVTSVGHCHPAVVAAIREQAGRLIHVGNLFYTEPMLRLAERLVARQLRQQRTGDLLRNRVFDLQHVGRVFIKLFRPTHLTIAHIQ